MICGCSKSVAGATRQCLVQSSGPTASVKATSSEGKGVQRNWVFPASSNKT